MAIFAYKMFFSPYGNSLKANNYEDAWKELKKTYPNCRKDIKKRTQFLTRQY